MNNNKKNRDQTNHVESITHKQNPRYKRENTIKGGQCSGTGYCVGSQQNHQTRWYLAAEKPG